MFGILPGFVRRVRLARSIVSANLKEMSVSLKRWTSGSTAGGAGSRRRVRVRLRGAREDAAVWLDGSPLLPGGDAAADSQVSAEAFGWGSGGSALAGRSLASAILLRLSGDVALAAANAPALASEVLARLPDGDFDCEIELGRFLAERIVPGFPHEEE